MADAPSSPGRPSAFFSANEALLRSTAEIGPTLDLACGRGRHALAAAELGLQVVALDRNRAFLAELADVIKTRSETLRIETVEADLEGTSPPALADGSFGAILVFRYLHRPLMPWIEGLMAPGSLLLYETFTTDQRQLGWGPKRDDFLLDRGELPKLFPNLVLRSYEEGPSHDTPPAHTARLLASRPD